MKKIVSCIFALAMLFALMALPVNAEGTAYPYVIKSLTAKSADGTEYDTPPSDRSFIAELEVEKVGERDNSDYFIVAVYGTNGSVIGLNYAYANMAVGQKIAYGVNIPKIGMETGEIRAFIWDSLSGMKPLSETVKKVCSGIEPSQTEAPIVKPTIEPTTDPNLTRLAVYNTYFNTIDDFDNEVDTLEVFINGEKTTVNCESSVSAASFGLERGDAILMETNESGEVIAVMNLTKDIDLTDTDTIWSAALTKSADLVDNSYVAALVGKEKADLFFGAVTGGIPDKTIELSDIVDGVSYTTAVESISFDVNCNVYVVDYNERSKNRISVGTTSNAQKTNIIDDAYDNDRIMITWNKNAGNQNPRLALVRTYGGNAMDVVVYLPKK